MKDKLLKAIALASLGAFLTVGIGANVAQAKDYHFKIGENHRMVKNDDGTVDSSAHPWYKVKEKKIKKCMLIITNMHLNNIKYQMNCTPKIVFNFWGAVFLCQNILKI